MRTFDPSNTKWANNASGGRRLNKTARYFPNNWEAVTVEVPTEELDNIYDSNVKCTGDSNPGLDMLPLHCVMIGKVNVCEQLQLKNEVEKSAQDCLIF